MNLRVLLFTGAVFATIAVILSLCSVLLKDKSKLRAIWFSYFLEFLILGAILVPAYFGGIVFATAVGILGTISLMEYLGIQKTPPPLPLRITCVLSGIAVFVSAYLYDHLWLYILFPLSATALFVISIFMSKGKAFVRDAAVCLLGLVYVSLFFSHIILIRKFESGFLLVFFMYAVCEINDSFAYMFGKLFGKRKIFHGISPNKTYGGFFFGIFVSFAIAMALNALVTKFPYHFAIAGAFIVIAFGLLGDIVSSKIKRALDVKDFSNSIPTLGGVLDIYDSLIFVAPFFFYLTALILR
jgi:phosphatidate cytidylyltransferase